MAKKVEEEPKYDCNERIDGTKVYNYFNPPKLEESDNQKKAGIKSIVWGSVWVILAIALRVVFSGSIINYIMLVLLTIGALCILKGVLNVNKAKKLRAKLEAKIVTDEEYDRMELTMLQGVKERGMDYINLDEDEIKEADPLILHRYGSGGVSKTGQDGKYRSTEVVTTVFYFTVDAIFIYNYKFSMKNKITSEDTLTLFYSDIVTVRVGSIDAKAGEEDSFGLRQLSIGISGGQTETYRFVYSDQINTAIHAMQSLLRSKKKSQ